MAYHYLYHSLFHCHHLKNPYPQSLLQAQILAKKKKKEKNQLCSYEENAILDITKLVQKKRRTVLLTILCHLPTRHLCIHWSDETWIISPDLQFYLGVSVSVAWSGMIPRNFMNEWCLYQVNSPDLCFTPMFAHIDNRDLWKHEWEGWDNLMSFSVLLFLYFPPCL